MTASIVVRPARRGDFLAWKALWDAYHAFYGRAGPTALAPEITQTTWLRFFDEYEPMHALVAEADDAMLGLAHYLYHRSTIMLGPVCYLQDLYTVDSARRRGIGRALIQAVYERAKAAGSTRVYWLTHQTNSAAMELYDKLAEKSGFLQYRHDLGGRP